MGRHPKFERGDVVSAALRVVSEIGPQALTVSAVANAIGAPIGSIYHRFDSREQLLAELWMEVVEGFQDGFVSVLDSAEDVASAIEAAQFMGRWSREHPREARLLLLHRRQDFVSGGWPSSLAARAAALEPQLGVALKTFGRRAFGRADAEVIARLRFALLDAPFGGIKPYVQAAKPIPPVLDELIAETVRATLAGIG